MHELPVVEEMINALDEESGAKHISRIKEIHLEIGELSSYESSSIQMYFDIMSEGHTCEGARLSFEVKKAMLKCTKCGSIFEHEKGFDCPVCGGDAVYVKGSGSGYTILRILV